MTRDTGGPLLARSTNFRSPEGQGKISSSTLLGRKLPKIIRSREETASITRGYSSCSLLAKEGKMAFNSAAGGESAEARQNDVGRGD